ncbi:hypothetical protein PCC8801_3625 [Rippkaea orientalis PCC 8801]|uniref:Uncharacterized protein n=1 Tax=Rippkaea orientalis (strain PCC 8801 / RF-1) TaxID=41431 RepID=B7K1P5_RIPO1|nr:hypothetical protein [Rippkaea orientalis]ACK67587.1 hypothetical protein PCC8801_3625 [Rippkaea orientalis PCC 8801]
MKRITNQVILAMALGITSLLTSFPVIAQSSTVNSIIVAQHSASMTPEQMRQHHQKLIGQMQQMLKQMEEQMEQMTPEEITQMQKQHQQMMSDMEHLMEEVHKMHMMMTGNGTMNNHHTPK